jgi:OPA family glycerol-3-phosphate transporter-like MFS transporter
MPLIQHSAAYRRRRIMNWLPLGLTYAFLYMGRYNLTVAKIAFGEVMSNADFGIIFLAGAWTYAFAFVINGPLTDKIGGRRAILISAAGSAVMNILMGLFTYYRPAGAGLPWGPFSFNMVTVFSILYSLNMYFQSFGAVSIVKVNASWFHVRERGVFGGIFGVLISAGIYFAFQWGEWIVDTFHTTITPSGERIVGPPYYVFFIPAAILLVFWVIDFLVVRDRPSGAGFEDFDTEDASSGESDIPDPLGVILRKVITNPVVLTVAGIEFCTGVLRQGIMHWYPIFGNQQGFFHEFVLTKNWGLVLFLAGSTGGLTAGWMSDKVFGSRRGPVAGLLYALMLVAVVIMAFSLSSMWILGICAVVISYCVIGSHGMLSGTATQDFGGRKNAGTAVGLIDGMVYLGTGVQSISLGFLTERSWSYWPLFLIPFAVIGLLLSWSIRYAMPRGKKAH